MKRLPRSGVGTEQEDGEDVMPPRHRSSQFDHLPNRVYLGFLPHHAEVVSLKGDSYRLKDRDLGRVPDDDAA